MKKNGINNNFSNTGNNNNLDILLNILMNNNKTQPNNKRSDSAENKNESKNEPDFSATSLNNNQYANSTETHDALPKKMEASDKNNANKIDN